MMWGPVEEGGVQIGFAVLSYVKTPRSLDDSWMMNPRSLPRPPSLVSGLRSCAWGSQCWSGGGGVHLWRDA